MADNKATDEKELTLEMIMQTLEKKVDALENENLSLEEAFDKFKEGMELVKMGNDSIDRVEKKIEILMNEEE